MQYVWRDEPVAPSGNKRNHSTDIPFLFYGINLINLSYFKHLHKRDVQYTRIYEKNSKKESNAFFFNLNSNFSSHVTFFPFFLLFKNGFTMWMRRKKGRKIKVIWLALQGIISCCKSSSRRKEKERMFLS